MIWPRAASATSTSTVPAAVFATSTSELKLPWLDPSALSGVVTPEGGANDATSYTELPTAFAALTRTNSACAVAAARIATHAAAMRRKPPAGVGRTRATVSNIFWNCIVVPGELEMRERSRLRLFIVVVWETYSCCFWKLQGRSRPMFIVYLQITIAQCAEIKAAPDRFRTGGVRPVSGFT